LPAEVVSIKLAAAQQMPELSLGALRIRRANVSRRRFWSRVRGMRGDGVGEGRGLSNKF